MTLTHGRPDPAHFDIRLAVEANPSHHGNVGSGWFGEVLFSARKLSKWAKVFLYGF